MKALMVAMAAMIGLTACNREAKREGDAAARETAEESREAAAAAEAGAVNTGDAVSREARQTGNDVREGAGQLTDKAATEARQTGRDIREGADKAGTNPPEQGRKREETVLTDKAQAEARQTDRDVKAAVGVDKGASAEDKQLLTRIRTALRADKDVAAESRDVRIEIEKDEIELEGTVASKEAKDGIARIVRQVAGAAVKIEDEVKVADRVGADATDR